MKRWSVVYCQRSALAGVVARVEGLRGRNSSFEAREAGLAVRGSQVEGLFESVLSEAFDG
jgi:hypothetical protein